MRSDGFRMRVPMGISEGLKVGTAVGEEGIRVGVLVGMEGAADGPAVGILGMTLGDTDDIWR